MAEHGSRDKKKKAGKPKGKIEKAPEESAAEAKLLSNELRKLQEERLKLEEERKRDLKRMEQERIKVVEENRRLQAELLALRKELKREDTLTHRIEKDVEEVEHKIAEGKGAIDELESARKDAVGIKEKLEDIHQVLDEMFKWRTEITSKMNELEDAVRHAKHVPTLREKVDEMSRHISKKAEAENLKKIEKGIKGVSEDIDELGEELGYGESLNVAKIPPQVLEAAYQSILDDLVKELRKSFGSHEAERVITNVTEDLRQRTSGSELFRVRGANIELEDVVRSIEKGLISNKQVQMTYEELVKKLAEHVPYYKPKNLRAMLKIKSLEFAVDKLRVLIAENEYVKKELDKLLKARDLNLPKSSKSQTNVQDLVVDDTPGGEESA